MTTKRITRSAVATGNLVKIAEPQFLSLVGKPANQRPFPIIRSQQPGRVARTKRGDNAVLMLTFPEGYTEDDAARTLANFSMTGYSVSTDGTSVYAHRSDLQSVAKVVEMKPHEIRITSDGVIAMVDPAQYQPKTADSVAKIAVAAYEFDKKTFDEEKIISWGKQNNVDIENDAIENSSSDAFCVSRGEVSDDTEVQRVQVAEGVVIAIYRCDVCMPDSSVPDMYSAAINEAAYGNWGWGQLDFNASMADRVFCDVLESAANRVDSVVRQILFYSELPLESRKQLVTRCLQQYGQFVNDAIDALPRQVLLLASRADVSKNQSITREDDTMKIDATAAAAAQKELDAIEAKRSADEAAAKVVADEAAAVEAKRAADEAAAAALAAAPVAVAAPAAVATPAADSVAALRSELPALIAAAVAAAMTPAAVATPAATAAVVAEPAVRADAPALTVETLAAAIAAAQAPLLEKIERMSGETVLRSDGTDPTKVTPATKSAFRGILGDLGRSKE